MKLNAFTILSLSLSLPLLAVEPPQVKPQPKPGIRPLPRPLPGRGPGRLPGRFPGQQKPQPVKWGEKQIVVTATIEGIKQGPTARSFPPIYNNTLTLKIDSVLRGSVKAGAMVQAHHAARQVNKPDFPKGKIVVAPNNSRGGFRVEGLEAANDKKLAAVKLACELPLGWKIIEGKVASPWVAQKNRAWRKAQKVNAKHLCAITGRPALMAGGGVSFAVEKMPPAKAIKFRNPDGDGEYKVTITNPTKAPLTIPALHNKQTDHAGANDHRTVTQSDGRSIHRMHSDRHRLNHCCVFEGEVIRHRINDVFGHHGVLSKAAMLTVVSAGYA